MGNFLIHWGGWYLVVSAILSLFPGRGLPYFIFSTVFGALFFGVIALIGFVVNKLRKGAK